jgi:hypothetical protein
MMANSMANDKAMTMPFPRVDQARPEPDRLRFRTAESFGVVPSSAALLAEETGNGFICLLSNVIIKKYYYHHINAKKLGSAREIHLGSAQQI